MAYVRAEQVDVGEDQVAVAITHGTLGAHLGVAYRDSEGASRLFHLAFHRTVVVNDYPLPEWLAACVPIDEIAGAQIVSLIDGAAKLYPNPKMPGSFDYGIALLAGAGSIAADGTYSPKDGCDGYTCASIIAEIFRSFGFPLVDLATWQPRDINRAWGRAIVCMLEAYGAADAHVQAVERNISGLRLRPEEVAAAAERFQLGQAATFAEVELRADEVMAQVKTDCAPPDPRATSGRMAHCVEAFQEAIKAAKAVEDGSITAISNESVTAVQVNPEIKEAKPGKIDAHLRWKRHSPKRRSRRRKRS